MVNLVAPIAAADSKTETLDFTMPWWVLALVGVVVVGVVMLLIAFDRRGR